MYIDCQICGQISAVDYESDPCPVCGRDKFREKRSALDEVYCLAMDSKGLAALPWYYRLSYGFKSQGFKVAGFSDAIKATVA